jgi:RimJ/RimL family protein N-acetyltransferase
VSLVYGQDARVTEWVASQYGDPPPPSYSAIGFERNGELVAGVYFDGMSDNNVCAHIAAVGLLPVELLAAVAAYAYNQLGLDRMTFMIEDDNTACIRFVEAMGAELEGRMVRTRKRGDTLIYVLWKTCRFWRKLCETGRA